VELATPLLFGTWNVEAAPSFLENLCTHGIISSVTLSSLVESNP